MSAGSYVDVLTGQDRLLEGQSLTAGMLTPSPELLPPLRPEFSNSEVSSENHVSPWAGEVLYLTHTSQALQTQGRRAWTSPAPQQGSIMGP